MKQQELEAWRENPVTLEVLNSLHCQLDGRKKSILAVYWAQGEASETERLYCQALEQVLDYMETEKAEKIDEWNDK